MKNKVSKYSKYGLALVMPVLLSACADDNNFWGFLADRPDEQAEYDYLKNYDALKTYVDRSEHPDFKTSIALTASDYLSGTNVYAMANANFDELVAGNAMKMASCVSDKGVMDFSTVTDFVDMADESGQTVYGHCLAWHSQQSVNWLSSLLAPRPIEVDPSGMKTVQDYELDCSTLTSLSWSGCPDDVTISYNTGGGVKFSNSVAIDPWYAFQYWLVNGITLSTDYTYTVKMVIEAASDMDLVLNFKLGDWGGGFEKKLTVAAGEGSKEFEFEATPTMSSNGIFLQNNDGWIGTYVVKSVAISHKESAAAATYWSSLVDNGDMEGDDAKNFCTKSDQGNLEYAIVDGVGVGGSRGAKITSKGGYADSWESQFWIVSNEALPEGSKLHVAFDYRADGGCAGTSVDTQAHFGPGEYQYWQCAGTLSFTDEWKSYDKTFTVDGSMAGEKGMKSIAFNMSPNSSAGAYYIDNVVLEIEKESTDGIPLTDQEKKDTLIWAMNKWCQGIMSATDGLVKAWDLINEPLGQVGNDGYCNLKSAEDQGSNSWDVGGTAFYWMDYLGDEDYGPIVEKAARDAYKDVTGTDGSDLKLFVNDYNLEYSWYAPDQMIRVKSLVQWVNRWEERGKKLGYNTKIDGLGTQMHISYYEDEAVQKERKELITEMLKILANSGRLVRISELDMGYVDANGNSMTTAQINALPATECFNKKKAMADFYQWIIQQYMTIIPQAQQYGICQWCATDSPAGSGWRAGEPVGLWNESWERKPAYGGWCDGLSQKQTQD